MLTWDAVVGGRRYDRRTMDGALPKGSLFADRYRIDHLIGEGRVNGPTWRGIRTLADT